MHSNLGELDPAKQLYRIPEAMYLLGLGRSLLYEQIRANRLHSVKEGRTRLIPASAIREYVKLLKKEAGVIDDEAA